MTTKAFSKIAVLLETFFTDHLMTQRQVSQHTIASYRERSVCCLSLLKENCKDPRLCSPSTTSPCRSSKLLFHLESTRALSARTRNTAGGHSLLLPFRGLYLPEKSHLIQQVLALPSKRYKRTLISFLTEEEVTARLLPQTQLRGAASG